MTSLRSAFLKSPKGQDFLKEKIDSKKYNLIIDPTKLLGSIKEGANFELYELTGNPSSTILIGQPEYLTYHFNPKNKKHHLRRGDGTFYQIDTDPNKSRKVKYEDEFVDLLSLNLIPDNLILIKPQSFSQRTGLNPFYSANDSYKYLTSSQGVENSSKAFTLKDGGRKTRKSKKCKKSKKTKKCKKTRKTRK